MIRRLNNSFPASDLKEESFVTDMSILGFRNQGEDINVYYSYQFSRETTPSSELSERLEPKKKPAPACSGPTKIPSAVEIEEFFSEAEKYQQKRFSDKYNYDIVKDVPLEGKYQWVKLKP